MSKVTIFFLLFVGTFAYTSAHLISLRIPTSDDGTQVQGEPLANIFSRWLVDTISIKITEIARFFNLKIRVIKFLASLYTTENLILLRNLMEYAVKLGNLTLRYLPATVEDPSYWWISSLVQFLNNIHIGNGSIFHQFLAPTEAPVYKDDDLTGSESENVELSTDIPVSYNAPRSQQPTYEQTEAVSDDDSETSQPKATVDDDFIKTKTDEELLASYEARIMSLNKLINIKRK